QKRRKKEQDAEARAEGLGGSCPYGASGEYSDARAFVGGLEHYDVEWHNHGLNIFPRLVSPEAPVDENFENYATFKLPIQILNHLKELVKGAYNVAAGVWNFIVGWTGLELPHWSAAYPTIT